MSKKLNRIIQGDCIKGMGKLEAESVDLAFADPPFNIGYDYDAYDDRRDAEDYLDWSRQWIEGVKRVLKPDGTFWLAIGDEFAAELKVLCTRELGFHCRSWVVWFYTFGVHCKSKFTRSHAHIFHFVKDPKRFTFNSLDVRVPSARQIVYGDKRADPDGRVPDDTWMMAPVLPEEVPTKDGFVLRPQDIPQRFPADSDTWFFSRVAGTFKERMGFHGCQMPEQLLGRIIRASSHEGELVLDPFAGSGTTLAVAKKLGRHFVGYELSKEYATQVKKRLKSSHLGEPLEGPEDAATSAPPTKKGRKLQQKPRIKTSESPIVAKVNLTLGQVAVANGELFTAIAEAFMSSHQGYSADRVLADSALSDIFLENCKRLGIPGDEKEWNHLLLNLRKRSGLSGIDTSRRTTMHHAEIEPFQFASEIAWRKLHNSYGCTLDDILCDPSLKEEFGKTAEKIAPGFSTFKYLWAAIRLRKNGSRVSKYKDQLEEYKLAPTSLSISQTEKLPCISGHYLITVKDSPFFTGYADRLREHSFFNLDRLYAALDVLGNRFKESEIFIRRRNFNPESIRKRGIDIPSGGLKYLARTKILEKYNPIGNEPASSAA